VGVPRWLLASVASPFSHNFVGMITREEVLDRLFLED